MDRDREVVFRRVWFFHEIVQYFYHPIYIHERIVVVGESSFYVRLFAISFCDGTIQIEIGCQRIMEKEGDLSESVESISIITFRIEIYFEYWFRIFVPSEFIEGEAVYL